MERAAPPEGNAAPLFVGPVPVETTHENRWLPDGLRGGRSSGYSTIATIPSQFVAFPSVRTCS